MRIIAESERLLVRFMTEADVPALASFWADERVTRFMGGPREFDRVSESLRQSLRAARLQLDLWPVEERDSGIVVGHCGLLPKRVGERDEVELVYVIGSGFWGRGFATEAAGVIRDYGFRRLEIARLVSLIDPANTASERVATKIGMTSEGETVRPGGKTLNVFAIAAEPV